MPEFIDMVRWGFGNIFTPKTIDDFVLPIQHLHFYCINKEGYLKIFTKIVERLDDTTLNQLLDIIKNICEEFHLKFVGLPSKKYSWSEFKNLLGNDLKYEYNKEGKVILYV